MDIEGSVVVLAAEPSERDLCRIIRLSIEECGPRVERVSSEEGLIDLLDTHASGISAIILSATLGGQPVSKTILRAQQADTMIPIIVVAAVGGAEQEVEARRAGIFYYMTLPADWHELQQVTLWALTARSRRKTGRTTDLSG